MKPIICLFIVFAGLRTAAYAESFRPITATATPVDSVRYDFNGIDIFRQSFPDAQIRQVWQKDGVTTVRFFWDQGEENAWFDNKGELVATSGLIDSRTLPFPIRMRLCQEYRDYSVLQAREFFHLEKGLSYFLIVKKGEKALILKADTDGNLSVEKKLREP